MIKRNEQGILIVVSGPSGCGKSTVDNLLIKKRKNIIMSVSDTTRPPRNGEVNGKDYNFITAKEFEEYKQFKLNSMSAEEREKALKEENESLLTKIGILENTIETQTKEIERVKAQDSIKDKLNSLKTEKPYLTETIEKRVNKGFNSLDEVNEFVNLVDSPTMKEAYEVLQRTQKATKVTGNTVVNGNGNTVVRNDTDRPVDLTKYGILKK